MATVQEELRDLNTTIECAGVNYMKEFLINRTAVQAIVNGAGHDWSRVVTDARQELKDHLVSNS